MKSGWRVHIILIIISILFMGGHFLINSEPVKHLTAGYLVTLLEKKLETKITAESVELKRPCGLSVDNLTIFGLNQDTIASFRSVTIRMRLLPLIHKKLYITSVQLSKPEIFIHQNSVETESNYQFLLDKFSNRDRVKNRLNIRVNSIIIRNGSAKYDIESESETPGVFNPSHINIQGLSAILSVKVLNQDSLSVFIRQFRVREKSGLIITEFKGRAELGKNSTLLQDISLKSTNSHLYANKIEIKKGLSNIKTNSSGSHYLNLCKSYFSPSDISALFPKLASFNDRVNICANITGNIQQINLNQLEISSSKKELSITGSGVFQNLSEIENVEIDNAKISVTVNPNLNSYLQQKLTGFKFTIPSQLENLGNATLISNFSGNSSNFQTDLSIKSDIGIIYAYINSENKIQNLTLDAENIDLKTVTGNSDLGKGSLSLSALADGLFFNQPKNIQFSSLINNLDYKGYIYKGMNIEGDYINDTLSLNLNYLDMNAYFDLAAKYSKTDSNRHSLTMKVTTDSINMPALNLIDKNGFQYLSANVKANVSGNNIDDIRGEISIDDLKLSDSIDLFFLNNITLMAKDVLNNQRIITLNTDFLSFAITGNFSTNTLPQSLFTIFNPALPSLTNWTIDKFYPNYAELASENIFLIDVRIRESDFFEKILKKPLELSGTTTLHCYFNDLKRVSEIEVILPHVKIDKNKIENTRLLLNQEDDIFSLMLRGYYKPASDTATFCNLYLTGVNNIIDGSISWQNDIKSRFEGSLSMLVNFGEYNRGDKWIKSLFQIDTTAISLQNTDWKISSTNIESDSGRIDIKNFKLTHNDQFIAVDGVVSADSGDIINLVVKNIELEKMLGLFQNSNNIAKGVVSGNISALSLLDQPAFFGHVDVEEFSFFESYGGSLRLDAEWNKIKNRVDISAEMSNKDISKSLISGLFVPATKEIDMNIKADNTDIYFLNRFTKNIFKELSGKATGNIRFFGKPKEFNLEGMAVVENIIMEQNNLNTLFFIEHDTLWFEKDLMNFKNIDISDLEGNKGNLTCLIKHTNLKNFHVDFMADIHNMLVLNLIRTENSPLFARVYAQGSVKLNSNEVKGLSVQAKVKTGPGTIFGYNVSSQNVVDYEFLKIVDRSAILSDEEGKNIEQNNQKKKRENLKLDLDIECTNDADITFVMSNLHGSFNGYGNISAQYNSVDGIFLNGIYNVDHGICDLSIQDLIKKDFNIMENSFVRFNGPSNETELNLKTYHTVNSASIYDLAADANSSSNVKVRCLMDITGLVGSPSFIFDIDMPQATAEEKEILTSATSTEEQRNMQFMYLLAVGRFYTYDYSNTAYAYGMSPNTMEALLNSTVSGQINNILSQLFHSSSISLSSNVSAGSYLSNNADNIVNKELEGILEARLLNNRLLVNGNFGYRENAMTNTSNFIGDFEVKWLMFPKQGVSLKGYNKNNDRYFTKTTLTTQGVGIVFETNFDRFFYIRRRDQYGRLIGTSE
ncbi:MAG TPA: hypothetical protein VFC94_02230 [Bacteroidaceae bacterium]|nr:hypothetical protein [Bacteroidaceae bacterium]